MAFYHMKLCINMSDFKIVCFYDEYLDFIPKFYCPVQLVVQKLFQCPSSQPKMRPNN